MAEQVTAVIYRTGEHGGTFRTAYNITFFGDTATIQGVSGTITTECWREIIAYLILKGIKYYQYARCKGGRHYTVKRQVRC